MIDVSDRKRVHIDRDKGTATVQGGINTGEIVRELWEQGFAIPTGTATTTGVSGVTLGGGVGLLTRSNGLTSDSLASWTAGLKTVYRECWYCGTRFMKI